MLTRDSLLSTPAQIPASPVALLSRAGRLALRAAVSPDQPATTSQEAASLLQRVAQQGDGLRALLDLLAQDLAAGNVAAASTHLHAVLEPVRLLDEAQARFDEARQEAHARNVALPAWLGDSQSLGHLPDPATLRHLHAEASAAAAALDDLAFCAQALADLLDGGSI